MSTMAASRHQFSELKWTTHALRRCQQRAISKDAVQAAIWFGKKFWAGDGCVAYFLGRKSLRRAGPEVHVSDRYENVAVVVAPDGAVVTVQHSPRPKRRWRS